MSDRQHANPLVLRGLSDINIHGEVSPLSRVLLHNQPGIRTLAFTESWFQKLLFGHPTLLPAAEIEEAWRKYSKPWRSAIPSR